jgi:hypothetical protein
VPQQRQHLGTPQPLLLLLLSYHLLYCQMYCLPGSDLPFLQLTGPPAQLTHQQSVKHKHEHTNMHNMSTTIAVAAAREMQFSRCMSSGLVARSLQQPAATAATQQQHAAAAPQQHQHQDTPHQPPLLLLMLLLLLSYHLLYCLMYCQMYCLYCCTLPGSVLPFLQLTGLPAQLPCQQSAQRQQHLNLSQHQRNRQQQQQQQQQGLLLLLLLQAQLVLEHPTATAAVSAAAAAQSLLLGWQHFRTSVDVLQRCHLVHLQPHLLLLLLRHRP